jgi:hypothetical protein
MAIPTGYLVVIFDVDGQKNQKAFFTPDEAGLAEKFRAARRGRLLSHDLKVGATDLTPKGPLPTPQFVQIGDLTPVLTVAPAVPAVALADEKADYKTLQAKCKEAGLRATGSAAALAERLAVWVAAGRPSLTKKPRTRRKAVQKAVAA